MALKIWTIVAAFYLMLSVCKAQNISPTPVRNTFIDEIENVKQVDSLIAMLGERYTDFKVNATLQMSAPTCKRISDSLGITPWAKGDFDNNGLTDLLVIGGWSENNNTRIICILDEGDMNYNVKSLTRKPFNECTFPIIETTDQTELIKYYFQGTPPSGYMDQHRPLESITLTYKFGDFIEVNKNPPKHSIEKIIFETTNCYGSCPKFTLYINEDKTAFWLADEYNRVNGTEFNDNYKCIIKPDKYFELIELLNYINFDQLKDDYKVKWSDDQACTMKVVYDGGKTKTIHDYGLMGTFGLNKLYRLLFDLRGNQNWTKLL